LEQAIYVVAIGQNEVPAALGAREPGLGRLKFADDDAIQFYDLMRRASRKAFLLTVPDVDTQSRFSEAVQAALAPTRANLDQTVDELARDMAVDQKDGREPVLVFFYSGHGVQAANGRAAFALLDDALTQDYLYETLIAQLPAKYVHLIIDACHAGAIVRSRDVDATLESLSAADVRTYVDESTLERFPQVGAILASTATTQSFEWDAYQGGVFAHELLSGLRGGADVNGDGRIEYSELAAFFSAANLRVEDARARLEVVTTPPRSNARAPLLDHHGMPGEFNLSGRSEGVWTSGFHVESAKGARILDVFPEKDAVISLFLPSEERLFLLHEDQEVELVAAAGSHVKLDALRPHATHKRTRDALDASLRRGLFGTRFGPAFYLGFTSQRSDLGAVPFDPEHDAATPSSAPNPAATAARADVSSSSTKRTVGLAFVVASGVAAVATGVFTAKAVSARADYDSAEYERAASDASDRYRQFATAAWIGAGATVALGTTGAVLLLTTPPRNSVASNFTGARVGIEPTRITLSGAF
jgi:hypothetical protein